MPDLSDAKAGRKAALPARGEFETKLSHYCRRCRTKLAAPVENAHRAFCTPGCYSSFYLKRCVVCEKDKPAGRSDRRFCRRPKCRTEYRKNKGLFAPTGPSTDLCRLSSRSVQSTGIKIDDLADPKGRQIAGPELSASAFHCAMVDAEEAVEASRRANARYRREASAGTLVGPSDPPINLLGGYKFPNAPKLEAEPTSARVADGGGAYPIPTDLSVPNFFKGDTMTLSYRRAVDRMREPGTRLIKTHGPYGHVHCVVPGGHVEPATAERLKKHPLVQAGMDGLFPGHEQTWRLVSAANAPSRTR